MRRWIWIAIALTGLFITGGFNPLFAVDEQRKAYDEMVDEAVREADEYVEQKQQQIQDSQDDAQSQQQAELDERAEAESARIQAEMATVQGRGLGPNFSQGMKDNLLQQLQDKLDLLMSDPEAYFSGQ